MFNTLFLFIMLFATWVVFSGFFDTFFLVSGVVSCVAAIFISWKLGITTCESCRLYYRPQSIGYTFWLIKEIILSSWDVSIRMWQAEPDISPKLAWVPITQKNDVGRTMLANSITLTPGTVTVLVEEDRMCIHALCNAGIDSLLAGEMDKRVAAMVGNV